MNLDVQIKGVQAARASLTGLGRQVQFAAAKALTKTANQVNLSIKDDLKRETSLGATAYTLRAFKVTAARRNNLEARVSLRTDSPGKGSIWSRAVGHLFTGGPRDWKKMEAAFTKAGLLPAGQRMIPASNSWAMPLDANGNVPRGLVVQLISYFKAFGEQGYLANMTDERKGKLAKAGVSASGYKVINGVVYFVSFGAGRGKHLPAGIWAKRGTHGSNVAPVFLFVRGVSYQRKFDIEKTAKTVIDKEWERNFDSALTDALRTAR